MEDRLEGLAPVYTYTEGPELGHGRIETRTYRVYDGLEAIADKGSGAATYDDNRIRVQHGKEVHGRAYRRKRLYVSSLPTDTPALGAYVRGHWSIESMHWGMDVNLLQDRIKRKSTRAARNLDTPSRE